MAISVNTVWEVRTTGSDNNSGGFVAGASGMDYSQQAAAQFSGIDLASTNGTTASPQVTSASHSFVATDVGNIIHITAGTNWTTGFYQIVSVATGAATLDRACGSVAGLSGGTWAEGGALATVTTAVNSACIGGNTIWVQVGTYTTATSLVLPGKQYQPTILSGYNVNRGDLIAVNDYTNFPTLQASAGMTSQGVIYPNGYTRVRCLILDSNSFASTSGWRANGNYNVIENCKTINTANGASGFNGAGNIVIIRRCFATSPAGTGTAAGFEADGSGTMVDSCIANMGGNGGTGFVSSSASVFFNRCIAFGCLGTSGYGFEQTGTFGFKLYNCIAYNNAQHGVYFSSTNTADIGTVYNCILAKNGGYGININTTAWTDYMADYNAFWNNTSGPRLNLPAGAHDINLSGDPFNNAAGNDFSLNNTAGAGAACRAVGFPGILPLNTTTGYLDLGVAQHQDTGGSSGGRTNFLIQPNSWTYED